MLPRESLQSLRKYIIFLKHPVCTYMRCMFCLIILLIAMWIRSGRPWFSALKGLYVNFYQILSKALLFCEFWPKVRSLKVQTLGAPAWSVRLPRVMSTLVRNRSRFYVVKAWQNKFSPSENKKCILSCTIIQKNSSSALNCVRLILYSMLCFVSEQYFLMLIQH